MTGLSLHRTQTPRGLTPCHHLVSILRNTALTLPCAVPTRVGSVGLGGTPTNPLNQSLEPVPLRERYPYLIQLSSPCASVSRVSSRYQPPDYTVVFLGELRVAASPLQLDSSCPPPPALRSSHHLPFTVWTRLESLNPANRTIQHRPSDSLHPSPTPVNSSSRLRQRLRLRLLCPRGLPLCADRAVPSPASSPSSVDPLLHHHS